MQGPPRRRGAGGGGGGGGGGLHNSQHYKCRPANS